MTLKVGLGFLGLWLALLILSIALMTNGNTIAVFTFMFGAPLSFSAAMFFIGRWSGSVSVTVQRRSAAPPQKLGVRKLQRPDRDFLSKTG